MRHPTLVSILVLAALPHVAFGQIPAGGEFRVNTYTTDAQYLPAVAMDAAGNFVVVWQGLTQDGGNFGIFGQRYDAAGTPQGAEFQVNSYTTGDQALPAVAMAAGGSFVVVWDSAGSQDGNGYGIFGQRFDAAGAPVGGEFQVNTYTTHVQRFPAVAAGAAGTFVVVWQSQFQEPGGVSGYGIFGRRYDATGAPTGGEFQINTYTTDQQERPRVAMDTAGNFVVVWQSFALDASGRAVVGQRYDAAGAPQGSEFRVNTFTVLNQYHPAVAVDMAGDFIVAWASLNQDGNSSGVFGQRYDAAGVAQGGEFRVNSYTPGLQYYPAVATDAQGNFVVVWASDAQDGDRRGIFGQRYDAAGVARGGEFRVNTYTVNNQREVAVAMDTWGNFVVAWQSISQDGSSGGIFAQRYGGLLPAGLAVDPIGNGVLEPGETVPVVPAWRNLNGGPLTFTGTSADLTGPPGATYLLTDNSAGYGTAPDGVTRACSDCYTVFVSSPATRPALHWDLTVRETIGPPTLGQTTVWTLHVGASFPDVPPSHPFYRFVETLLHVGVTAGCTATTYCPDGVTTREQMAVFLLRAREGGGYAPPPCTTAPFPDVPCSSPFAPWVQELVARGITAGCGSGLYCPTAPVTREQMAVFLLKSSLGTSFTPPPCATASFADVPCASPFAPWVQALVARGITAGCGGGLYCPTDPVTRGQMAVFLTKTFGLTLYGP
jgi:hypothetical protein